jgi:hypothetical protein
MPVDVATRDVVIRSQPLANPDGIRTGEGSRNTKGLLLVRVIDAPPEGAGPISVTVRTVLPPPLTVTGLRS